MKKIFFIIFGIILSISNSHAIDLSYCTPIVNELSTLQNNTIHYTNENNLNKLRDYLTLYKNDIINCSSQSIFDTANTTYYEQAGIFYADNGDYDTAIEKLEISLNIKYSSTTELLLGGIYANRGDKYMSEGNYTKAISDFEKAIEYATGTIYDDTIDVFNARIGKCYFHLGQYTKGMEYYIKVERVGKLYADEAYDMCWYYKDKGENVRALELCNKSLLLSKDLELTTKVQKMINEMNSIQDKSNTSNNLNTSNNSYTCGLNSYPTGNNKCACKEGYVWQYPGTNNFDCITEKAYGDSICVRDFGTNSVWDGEYASNGDYLCDCKEGFSWSENQTCKLNITYSYQEYKPDYYTKVLSERGIIVYKPNLEDYNINQNVLRQEIGAVTRGLAGIERKNYCENIFKDVNENTPNDWVCYTIEALADNGIIAKNNYFNPEQYISKAEALGMIVGAMYKDSYAYNPNISGTWQEQVVSFAVNEGIVKKFYDYDTNATRGFVFNIAVNTLEKQSATTNQTMDFFMSEFDKLADELKID